MKFMLCAIVLLLAACAQTPAARMTNDAALPISAANSNDASAPAPTSANFDPGAVSRACKVDADCEIKNVGNCCGAHPTCVNKDAATDPDAVRAQCRKEHRAGVCSMEAIGGCSCVQGQCSNINAAQMPGMH